MVVINERTKLSISDTSQHDIPKLVHRALQPFGRYQKCVFMILCFNSAIIAINSTISQFYIYTPKSFTCSDYSDQPAVNATCVEECKDYVFFDTDQSVVTEFSLICDRRYLSAAINTAYFCGYTIGYFISGILTDIFGRRKLIFICLYCQGIAGACLYFSNNVVMFMILRLIQGLFIPGLQSAGYSLMQELTPPRHLTMTGLMFDSFRALGMIFLGVSAFFIRDWRVLQLVLAIPTAMTLIWSWLIPESPKWLSAKDKDDLALQQVIQIARRNNDIQFLKECEGIQLQNLKEAKKLGAVKVVTPNSSGKMVELFKNGIIIKHICVMMIVWFSCNWSYFGFLLFTPQLAGGRHLSFIIGALIEAASCFLAFFLLSSRLGRRLSIVIFMYTNVILYLTFGLLFLNDTTEPWVLYTTGIISLIGKGIAIACVGGMHIYAAELFPTMIRTSATGFIGVAARVGSLTAPQIMLLGELTHPIVSNALMAALLFIGGTATLVLPETLNKKLPDTLDDVNDAWGKRRFSKYEQNGDTQK